jgi:nucleoid-associated protein YgaU
MKTPYQVAVILAFLAATACVPAEEAEQATVEAEPAAVEAKPAAVEAEPAAVEAEPAAAEEVEKGVVITAEDQSQRCILALVVTQVDGQEVKEGEPSDRFEFEPGEHTISGYGAGDPSLCATFSGENGIPIPEGERIGESALKLNVEPGKVYYLGVDVRSTDKSRWKVVAWKIKH